MLPVHFDNALKERKAGHPNRVIFRFPFVIFHFPFEVLLRAKQNDK